MNKPVLGMLLGGVLGIFDGLSALVSAPETQSQILGIVIGSTFKGILAGAIIGWIATRARSPQTVIWAGLGVGALLAFIVAAFPQPDGTHYWWQIMLPGSVLGLIVGYATLRYGKGRQPATR
jgi:peptidoglycan/LPS O-acetylase OafA/YrhL